jgi:hypothetical protein
MIPAMQMPANGVMNPMMSMMNPMMGMMNPMMGMPMNPMMMNGMMGMPMPMPMMMCQMTCEMTPDGMVCTMKPMDGMAMDMMKDCCDRMNAAMSMGMPAMMMCPNMPMMMCMPAKK